LIIDRGDKTINLCEMKYSSSTFTISSDYAERMKERKEAFVSLTGTNKSIHLTMISAEGLDHNEGWNSIQSEVTLNDLFEESVQ